MGFRRQMVNMVIGGKSPEEIARLTRELMPEVMEKMGPEDMARLMSDLIPQIIEKVGRERMAQLLQQLIPSMMQKVDNEKMTDIILNVMFPTIDNCLASMGQEQRRFLLNHSRSILDSMEKKYLA